MNTYIFKFIENLIITCGQKKKKKGKIKKKIQKYTYI